MRTNPIISRLRTRKERFLKRDNREEREYEERERERERERKREKETECVLFMNDNLPVTDASPSGKIFL